MLATGPEGLLIDPAAGGLTAALPEGTCLLHIGPHKTGTTGLQQALYLARDAMREQGVGHPSSTANPASAVHAVTGRRSRSRGARVPSIRLWRRLVRDVRRAREPRVVISSEMFADAHAETIPRIVRDLGSSRLHVVVTLRPLARILPSQWQQHVQNGMVTSYDRWLAAIFDEQPGRRARLFWRRHRHDRLIDRWAAVTGARNLTVVVLDDRDPALLLRRFEQLLGLSEGTLRAPVGMANRSLSMPETEAIRAFNRAFKRQSLDVGIHAKAVTFGAAGYLKQQPFGPNDTRIETPRWALDRAAEIQSEIVDRIATAGVRVIGDLDSLKAASGDAPDHERPSTTPIAPEIAARFAMGIVFASSLARERRRPRPGAGDGREERGREPTDLRLVPTYVVMGALAMRVREASIVLIQSLRRRRPRIPHWRRP